LTGPSESCIEGFDEFNSNVLSMRDTRVVFSSRFLIDLIQVADARARLIFDTSRTLLRKLC